MEKSDFQKLEFSKEAVPRLSVFWKRLRNDGTIWFLISVIFVSIGAVFAKAATLEIMAYNYSILKETDEILNAEQEPKRDTLNFGLIAAVLSPLNSKDQSTECNGYDDSDQCKKINRYFNVINKGFSIL